MWRLLVAEELTDEELLVFAGLGMMKEDPCPWPRLDLATYTDEECVNLFRFTKDQLYHLLHLLQFPEKWTGSNGLKWSGMEGLCVLLRRLSYPNRLCDLVPIFGFFETEISVIFNTVLNHVFDSFGHLLTDVNQPWLTVEKLKEYAAAIHGKGMPLRNCWGFIDGTVMPICRPMQNQKEVYNGHKRTHALKYQSIVLPNGIIANLFGPIEGRRHDAALLAESQILNQIQFFTDDDRQNPLCIYGDSAYPLNQHLLCPYKGSHLTPEQAAFNKAMSSGREAVEWQFGKIVQYFAFVDFKKNQKVYLQPVGKYYFVAALMANCHTCFNGSQTADYFGMNTLSIDEYLYMREIQ